MQLVHHRLFSGVVFFGRVFANVFSLLDLFPNYSPIRQLVFLECACVIFLFARKYLSHVEFPQHNKLNVEVKKIHGISLIEIRHCMPALYSVCGSMPTVGYHALLPAH